MTDFFDLLPEKYRALDEAQGFPLRAFLETLQEQHELLYADAGRMYWNWFIETAQEWAWPHIAALVGLELPPLATSQPQLRRAVAHAVAMRRRKGTIPALEHAVYDWTDWFCAARPWADEVADTSKLADTSEVAGTSKRVDTAEPAGAPARVDAPGALDVHLWRVQTFSYRGLTPGRGEHVSTFDPFGLERPLFNPPRPRRLGECLTPETAPVPLEAATLAAENRALREGEIPATTFLSGTPAFQIYVSDDAGGAVPVPPLDIHFADLSGGVAVPPPVPGTRFIVDPERGRFQAIEVGAVSVDCTFGARGALGGGPYLAPNPAVGKPWTASVLTGIPDPTAPTDDVTVFGSIGAALAAFGAQDKDGLIRILDSATQSVPANLEIGPRDGCSVNPLGERTLVVEATQGEAPAIRGRLDVVGCEPGTVVRLRGLRIQGGIRARGQLRLVIEDCTVASRSTEPALDITGDTRVTVEIRSSVIGPVRTSGGPALTVEDSVVDAGAHGRAIVPNRGEKGAALKIVRSTVTGSVEVETLRAADSIFVTPVHVRDVGTGWVRYSFVAPGSHVPPRTSCQPASPDVDVRFVSVAPGSPEYMALADDNPPEILEGGENGSEMGVFNRLGNADRYRLLEKVLAEYVPAGLRPRAHFHN